MRLVPGFALLLVVACARPLPPPPPSCENALERQLAGIKASSSFQTAPARQQAAVEEHFAGLRAGAIAKCEAAATVASGKRVDCLLAATTPEATAACHAPEATCETVVDHMLVLVRDTPEYKSAPADMKVQVDTMLDAERPKAIEKCKHGKDELSQPQLDCVMAAKDVAQAERCTKKAP